MKTKVLFFINGSLPTEDELLQAKGIDAKVCFRNALMIGDEHKPEDCDFVTGAIPEAYFEFPEWEFEIKVPSNPVKPAPKTPAIKSEPKTPVAGWKPNA